MDSNEQFRAAVQAGQERIRSLLPLGKQYFDELPKIVALADRRDRLGRFFGKPKFTQRLVKVYEGRSSTVGQFWRGFKLFTDDARSAVEQLRNILPAHEVDDLLSKIHPSAVRAAYEVLQQAAERLNEFLPEIANSVPSHPRSQDAPQAVARLRAFLNENGMTYTEFSTRIGGKVTPKTIGKFLRTGTVRPSVLDDIAGGMGISKQELLRP